jgi:hypothetical protein
VLRSLLTVLRTVPPRVFKPPRGGQCRRPLHAEAAVVAVVELVQTPRGRARSSGASSPARTSRGEAPRTPPASACAARPARPARPGGAGDGLRPEKRGSARRHLLDRQARGVGYPVPPERVGFPRRSRVLYWRRLIDGTTAWDPAARWTMRDVETHLGPRRQLSLTRYAEGPCRCRRPMRRASLRSPTTGARPSRVRTATGRWARTLPSAVSAVTRCWPIRLRHPQRTGARRLSTPLTRGGRGWRA